MDIPFRKVERGEQTQFDLENWSMSFIDGDKNTVTSSLIDFLEAPDYRYHFRNKLINHIVRLGYRGNTDNSPEANKELESFLKKLCRKAEVTILPQSIKDWLAAKHVPGNSYTSRISVYKLCFALQMDADQTYDFFLNAYLSRPFNFKDPKEAIYYFCLKNNLKYTDAERLICAYKPSNTQTGDLEKATIKLGAALSGIATEDKLMEFLQCNSYITKEQNKTAWKEFKELAYNCYKLALCEKKSDGTEDINKDAQKTATVESKRTYKMRDCPKEENKDIENVDYSALLKVIYGFDERNEKGNIKKLSNIAGKGFPFIQKAQAVTNRDLNNPYKQFDTMRKMLILLSFYSYYSNLKKNQKYEVDFHGHAENFVSIVDTRLNKCGYGETYILHPFDRMILACTQTYQPIETFRELLNYYYLSNTNSDS